jgi:hypothetical protein
MVGAYLQAFFVLPRISAMAPGFKDKIFRVKADEGLMLFTTLLHSLWRARSSKPQTELGSLKITTLSFVNLLSEHDEIIYTVYNMNVLYPEPFAKRSLRPNSALCSKFYPRNINYMPVVKFLACLDFERKS